MIKVKSKTVIVIYQKYFHFHSKAFIKAFGDNTFFGAGKSMGMGDRLLAKYKAGKKKT